MQKLFVGLFLFLVLTTSTDAQDKWIIKSEKYPGFIVDMTIANGKLEAATRGNALIDFMGVQKFMMVKSFYPVKYPEIVHFEGSLNTGTGLFSGTYNQLYTAYTMEAALAGDAITISLFDKTHVLISILKGKKLGRDFVPENFQPLAQKLVQTVEENLFDSSLLSSKGWQNYREKLLSNAANISDGLELQSAALALGLELPFSHLAVIKKQNGGQDPPFVLTDLDSATGLLEISSFTGSKKKMDDVIARILAKKYATLVIDLRNNSGGNHETALPLGNFLAHEPFISGFFPNRKWYAEHKRYPSQNDTQKFIAFTKGSMDDFYRTAVTGYGCYIQNIPAQKRFTGKVYVIVNEGTASTAEVFALALKENKIATIIGTKTAGQLLSAKRFSINDELELLVPLNDYISYAGYRVDKKGIQPDVLIKTDPVDYIRSLVR